MKIMAVDLGDARTGLALCDITETLASPLCVIEERGAENLLRKVAAAVKEHAAGMVVVGYPRHMNGDAGIRAQKSELFSKQLGKLADVPIILWDERGTTVSAARQLNETNTRGQKRKQIIDAVAAVIILENYLMYRRNQLTINN
ncbi:MAG: Holliday junction resolvase RuvX [Oscillospiraceae bacterium]|nr:Holliday junction resolvase RuvX [Oscillospiraceae bacterium]